MLAEIYVELEELDHAWTELQAAIGAEPLAFRAHYLLGTVHALRGDHTRAEVALRRSLYLEPDFATARFALGISLRALDQKQRACRELRSCLRSLRSMNPARLLTLTKGLPFPAKDLMGRCEQEIDEMGGTTQDSGIWQIPKKT
jgi:tetratricopeptide (TPR) repeat protein